MYISLGFNTGDGGIFARRHWSSAKSSQEDIQRAFRNFTEFKENWASIGDDEKVNGWFRTGGGIDDYIGVSSFVNLFQHDSDTLLKKTFAIIIDSPQQL